MVYEAPAVIKKSTAVKTPEPEISFSMLLPASEINEAAEFENMPLHIARDAYKLDYYHSESYGNKKDMFK
jgi:hypothetical protein